MKITLAIVFIILLSGCITNARISQDLSAGKIGCLPQDITIVNETAGYGGTHTWEAQCKGESYICSYHTTTGANCTPKK